MPGPSPIHRGIAAGRPVALLALGAAVLGACAAVAPVGPTLLSLPPQGKDMAQFQREDAGCRTLAASLATPSAPSNAQATSAGLQSLYDRTYAQCMASHGNTVTALPQPVYAPAYAYPYGGPYYGPGPYFGPTVGFGVGF